MDIINEEEMQFLKTLSRGRKLFERTVAKLNTNTIPGELVDSDRVIDNMFAKSDIFVVTYCMFCAPTLHEYRAPMKLVPTRHVSKFDHTLVYQGISTMTVMNSCLPSELSFVLISLLVKC